VCESAMSARDDHVFERIAAIAIVGLLLVVGFAQGMDLSSGRPPPCGPARQPTAGRERVIAHGIQIGIDR
jgi:hypothetical protein